MIKRKWTATEVKILKKLFPNTPTDFVAEELGRAVQAVKKYASRIGLKKTKKYLRSLGRKS